MNDKERAQWVDNHEGLYTWFKATRLTMRNFLRRYRSEIDKVINHALGR